MATQIKFHIQIRNYDEVVVNAYDRYLDPDRLEQRPVFTINESDNVYLSCTFDSCIKVEIEQPEGNALLSCMNDEIYHLSNGRDQAYFSGNFTIRITRDHVPFTFYFFVEPKQLEYRNVIFIRDYVNAFYHGLSLDLLKSGQRRSSYRSHGDSSILERYTYVANHFDAINKIIDRYMKRQPVSVLKSAEIKRNAKRVDAKTIRWLQTKGSFCNQDTEMPDLFLTRKTRFIVNTPNNQYFKSQVRFWHLEITSLLKESIALSDFFQTSSKNSLQQLQSLYQQREMINAQKRISRKYKQDLENKITALQNEQMRLEQWSSTYDQTDRLLKYKKILEDDLYDSWLTSVSDTVHASANTIALQQLSAYRNAYLGIKKQEQNELISFQEKSTPGLFETFVYVLLIQSLHEKGYILQDALDKEMFFYKLSDPSILHFKKDDIECEIRYDLPVKSQNEIEENDFCLINSSHNKPDFILSFKKENECIPFSSFIFEVKWRSYENIYHPDGDTEVVSNLKDYFNLAYYAKEDHKLQRGIISKVFVIYPDALERYTDILNEEIIAIGILPDQNLKTSKAIQHINECIGS